MTEAGPQAKQKCSYKTEEWSCPFDAEASQDHCIFHLPTDKKKPDDFWRHLANYLLVLSRLRDAPLRIQVTSGQPWLLDYEDHHLQNYYDFRRPPGGVCCNGFVFPLMDEHDFQGFAFGAADFRHAVFSDGAEFSHASFSGKSNFLLAKFGGRANFTGAMFGGAADFACAEFDSDAYFISAKFVGAADFSVAMFKSTADFLLARFGSSADLSHATFGGAADFRHATFGGSANFGVARFRSTANFGDATFSGPAYLSQATADALLEFCRVRLRNILLFEGTSFGDGARVLLWDVDFFRGTSDVTMEKGHERGQIIEPAGQIVFRDISAGMNRVSFLHTDILTDRLLVRFSNVKWETDPKQFIFDARFTFYREASKWPGATGLPEDRIASLSMLFHAGRPVLYEEPTEQRRQREAQELADCVPRIKQDVERIAREIRLSTEKYGSYSDAGNFHIAEMEYRRAQAQRFGFQWLLLTGYKCFSMYGESAGRALAWFGGVWFVSALLYMFTGFSFGKASTVRYAPVFDERFACPALWHVCTDFLHALAFSFVSLVPGYFRFSAPAEWPTWATPFIVVAEAVLGIGLLTLFLLAIRRRFRR